MRLPCRANGTIAPEAVTSQGSFGESSGFLLPTRDGIPSSLRVTETAGGERALPGSKTLRIFNFLFISCHSFSGGAARCTSVIVILVHRGSSHLIRRFGFSFNLSLVFWFFLAGLIGASGCSGNHDPSSVDGAGLFASRCARCHRENNDLRAPQPEALRQMSQSTILAALDSGRMKWEAKRLSKVEKEAMAGYLGKSRASPSAERSNFCPRDLDPPADPPVWAGWGADAHNSRFQPGPEAGLDREGVERLTLRWAFGFPRAAATFGQPTSFAGRLFVGSEDGTVYALDAATGCTWWAFRASATVKTAIAVGDQGRMAFFGDTNGYVYAVNIKDGSLVWKVHAESHAAARITGSPLVVGSRLYVPISSGEEGAAADPRYPCCTFRGSVVALETASGSQIWKTYTIDQIPVPTHRSREGVQYWVPRARRCGRHLRRIERATSFMWRPATTTPAQEPTHPMR